MGMCSAFARRDRVHSRHGFTLVELLIVIGIIAALIAILLPTISKARAQSKRTACMSNLRSIGQGMYLYAQAYRDRLPNTNPPGASYDDDAANTVMVTFNDMFVRSAGVFWCPGDEDPMPAKIETADYFLPNSAHVSYEFYSLYWYSQFGPMLTKMKGKAPLAWDLDGGAPRSGWHNHKPGGNVVFADGHAEWQEREDWERVNWPRPAGTYYRIR